ncbi:MAG: outer membrane homotrimeric porin [Thermodesulfobacteriota bacterium]|nr:outer membrane homotrimeric porin [Thermodesulfobacteriota bacterium]
MKRFLVLALALAFTLTATGLVQAGEVNMQGEFEQAFQWTDNEDFFDYDHDNTSEDDFNALQRIRVYFEYVANENLKGVFGIESINNWGDDTAATGGALGSNPTSLTLQHGYIDFNLPGTAINIRSGLQDFAMPAAMAGTPILDDDDCVAGIFANYQVSDQVGMTLGWARLNDRTLNNDPAGTNDNDEVDAFTAIVPVTLDGFSLTPYMLYAHHGANATAAPGTAFVGGLQSPNGTALGDDLDIWWGGVAFTMNMFDPIMITADLMYGAVDGDTNSSNDREGWFFDLGVDYVMDMFTPGVFFFWSSGDDDDPGDGSERMPSLGGSFAPSSFAFDGAVGQNDGAILSADGIGLWGLGLALKDFSFMENLTHTARVLYCQGTNDPDLAKKGYATGLTDKDHFWEVNLDSTYALYENLSACLELGYVNLDLDEEPWKNSNTGVWGGDPDDTDDAWKCSFALIYEF